MKQHVEVDGLSLSSEVVGEGPVVVLIHGFPLDRRMWESQVEALSGSCRVVAVDLRGFGESQLGPGDAARGVGMERYAEDVVGVLDGLGIDEPAAFAGFSMGGYVMWQIALQHPARVRGLLALDTRAIADTEPVREVRIEMADSIEKMGIEPVVRAMTPKLFAESTIRSRPAVVQRIQEIVRECSPSAVAAAQRGMAGRPDVTGSLPEISTPALVLCGSEDAISPSAEMRAIAEALPNAEYVEIAGAGHMTTAEEPQAVSEAMAGFIAKL